MANYKFIDTVDEIIENLLKFNQTPDDRREMAGGGTLYFVNAMLDGQQAFALSKFCAFKGVSADEYLQENGRHKAGGTETRKHLETITNQESIAFNELDRELQHSFTKWITSFYPNFNITKAQIIILPKSVVEKVHRKKKTISQETLEAILEHKKLIGIIGEEIAMRFEIERIRTQGAKDPEQFVAQTSKDDVNAGFDIYSHFNGITRFIEVKSNVKGHGDIFITKNEVDTFVRNETRSYIYLVNILDLDSRNGMVSKVITELTQLGELEPVLYKVVKT